MLESRHGSAALEGHKVRNTDIKTQQAQYFNNAQRGQFDLIYRFGEGLIDESAIEFDTEKMHIPGFEHPVTLSISNPFDDMCK